MKVFNYRIYQAPYCGPSKEDPFATKPLSLDQVQAYLDKLRGMLPNNFSTTAKDNSLFVSVTTCDSEQDLGTLLEQRVVQLNYTRIGLSLIIDSLP